MRVEYIARGDTALFDKCALTNGYTTRVLDEYSRRVVRRSVSAAEARALATCDPRWASGPLHALPAGVYRIQLINPARITVASVTVYWKETSDA